MLVAPLGTQMLNVTGTLADGAQTLGGHIVPTITAAAEKAGRKAPRIVASLPIALTSDVDAVREKAATEFQVYGFLPSYRAMLDREGAEGPADVAIVGDESVIEKGLVALRDTGVTEFHAACFGSREERTRTREFLKSLV